MVSLPIRHGVPLAPLTTLELGGPAEHFIEAEDERTFLEAFRWAETRGLSVALLGGGSNLVIADEGVRGLVVQNSIRGARMERAGTRVRLHAGAGEPWDALVERTVAEGLAGLECLSGIPGRVGATPIQNVGAYGREVAELIERVRVLDRRTGEVRELASRDCGFAYRDSVFKRHPGRHAVLGVRYALTPSGPADVRYAELARVVGGRAADLTAVRQAVLALRRGKSMVIDASDPNRRSVGSFFTNPIIDREAGERLAADAARSGLVRDPSEVPRWPVGDGRLKLAAGWLIERAGLGKGYRRGAFGLSSGHALAIVHHGGGTTGELIAFARFVRDAVRDRFGVTLVPEPDLLGGEDALWSGR